MKTVRSLILGSAAGFVAMGGAQAADLPVKAKAVEYVRICSLYGAGFYYIPGTDTCIKLGGYLRVAVGLNSTDFNGYYNGNNGQQTRFRNYYYARSRGDLNIDTRTATEYGVLRTYWDTPFTWTTANANSAGTFGNAGIDGSDIIGMYLAYLQFAGFTLGKAVPSSTLPGRTIPATASTVSSAVPAPSPASIS